MKNGHWIAEAAPRDFDTWSKEIQRAVYITVILKDWTWNDMEKRNLNEDPLAFVNLSMFQFFPNNH